MILLVDADRFVLATLRRMLDRDDVVMASSAKEALRLIQPSRPLLAAVVDIGLPDGSGHDLMLRARRVHGPTPLLALTGSTDPAVINSVQAAGAQVLIKSGDFRDNVLAFVRHAESSNLRFRVHRLSIDAGLSKGERAMVQLAVEGTPRAHLHSLLDVQRLTVKSYIARIAKKTGVKPFSELIFTLQRQPHYRIPAAASGDHHTERML